jgi:hypothetical protein
VRADGAVAGDIFDIRKSGFDLREIEQDTADYMKETTEKTAHCGTYSTAYVRGLEGSD